MGLGDNLWTNDDDMQSNTILYGGPCLNCQFSSMQNLGRSPSHHFLLLAEMVKLRLHNFIYLLCKAFVAFHVT